jgi:Amt family ammonium transporter
MYPIYIYIRSLKISSLVKLFIVILLLFNNNITIAADINQSSDENKNKPNEIDVINKDTKNIENIQRLEKINLITENLESLELEFQSGQKNSSLNTKKVNSMTESFLSIEKKIDDIISSLSVTKDFSIDNAGAIKQNKDEQAKLLRSIRASITDISLQKSLIEDNSIRLYEILVKIDILSEKIRKLSQPENKQSSQKTEVSDSIKNEEILRNDIDILWLIVSSILISLAPIAFILSSDESKYHALKDGTSHRQGIILVSLGVFLGYFLIGFGLMYGLSSSGWIGMSSYIFDTPTQLQEIPSQISFYEMLLYQMGFSVLAALIIYTAIGRLLSSTSHMFLSFFTGSILIPVFGHWVWATQFIPTNKGWLEILGFIDQAGATVIHTISAVFALVVILGLSKYDKYDKNLPIIGDFPVYSSSATLFLWISWQGLTTGILPFAENQITATMLNNGLAASAGGIMAFLHYVFFHSDKGKISRGLSGVITGLVAISACSSSVTAIEAIVIGASAGILQNLSYEILHQYFLKQDSKIPAAYLISIHGVGGIWGSLCVALLGSEGTFAMPNNIQIVIQLQGILAAVIYSVILGNIVVFLFNLKERTLTPHVKL